MFGLKDSYINQICCKLALFPEIEEAIIFGSRAMGNYKKGSDIDLALKGDRVSRATLNKLRIELEEKTCLPYSFDVLVLNSISNKNLMDHISNLGKRFYQNRKAQK